MSIIKLRFIWFDLGYTLVHLNREVIYQQHLHTLGIEKSVDEIALAYHLTDKYFMRQFPGKLGKHFAKYYFDYFNRFHNYLGIDIDPMLFKKMNVNFEWKAFPDTIPILKGLKNTGLGLGLISNWDKSARNLLMRTGIMDFLDHIVISSEIQIEKPDKRIFLHALKEANISPEQCLYVGDNYYDDVVGSRQVGMESILINPFDKEGIEEISEVRSIKNIKELPLVLR